MRADGEAGLLPSIEVAARVHLAAGALRPADGPVLGKSLGAVDAGGVGAGGLGDVVGAVVAVRDAELLRVGGGVVGAKILYDVVLDEGVA